jgi:hypothetical protein
MVLTYRNKFNIKYGFPKDESHSIADIARITGYKKSGLDTIFAKGVGAFKTNRAAVRPSVKSPEQWGQARVYAAINPASKAHQVDAKQLIFV